MCTSGFMWMGRVGWVVKAILTGNGRFATAFVIPSNPFTMTG